MYQNRSTPTFCHGLSGISWDMRVSLVCELSYSWHVSHVLIHSLISLVIPGQYTYYLALLIHPSIPVCPMCMSFLISGLIVPGITSLSPRKGGSKSRGQQEMEHWPCHVASLVVSPSSEFGVIRLVQFHREFW